ncbi:capsule assembly Wzi family protein [Dyadobacter sp. MSC1_007]|jgi:hypothetical protein|uniref:capsule assembly Wzi family protein n=1 Tax=Dyadobacter sp. MSC1_007 TaxID=2909264 RepID=UPI0020309049|nr:capsule assembly Wzi family protein [Dyadobacter sp. MSC1_007]
MRKFFFVLLASATLVLKGHSQDSTFFYSAQVAAAGSTSGVPFWLYANQNATIPDKGSFLAGRASFHRLYNVNNPRFLQWSGGVELAAYANKKSSVFFTDLFIAGKAGPVELSIGQRKDFVGLGDSLLTMGSVAMSLNYRPYPKIQLSTPKYVNLIPGSDFFSFKLSYSDGILGSGNIHYGNVTSVPEIYLHQKSVYLKLGGSHHKLNLFAGFNHQAMWGGEEKIFTGGLKTSAAYEYVVFGKPWGNSRVGNHFGTIDVAAEWKGKAWNLFLYRQTIYEDGSLSNLSSVADGLSGLRFKRKKRLGSDQAFQFNTVLLEFLYTKNQGGAVFDFASGIFGKDNYFNHYVYAQGWSYRGRGLGTPMLPPQNTIRENLTIEPTAFTANNKVIAYHLAAEASWKRLNFLFKGSYSQNFGTYEHEIAPYLSQTSLLLKVETPLSARNNDLLSLSLASDFGQLYPRNMAVMIGWKKSGFIR